MIRNWQRKAVRERDTEKMKLIPKPILDKLKAEFGVSEPKESVTVGVPLGKLKREGK